MSSETQEVKTNVQPGKREMKNTKKLPDGSVKINYYDNTSLVMSENDMNESDKKLRARTEKKIDELLAELEMLRCRQGGVEDDLRIDQIKEELKNLGHTPPEVGCVTMGGNKKTRRRKKSKRSKTAKRGRKKTAKRGRKKTARRGKKAKRRGTKKRK